jgi:hypothetical protein
MKLWKKFLVTRRDGTHPQWPYLVLGARDPAAPTAIRALADKSRELGMDPAYCDDLVAFANKCERYRARTGDGDPDAGPHRPDDPAVVDILDSIPASEV